MEQVQTLDDIIQVYGFLHLIALFTFQCWCLMVMQVMKFKRLFGEEQFSTSVARDVRVPGVDDLMRFQARIVIKS